MGKVPQMTATPAEKTTHGEAWDGFKGGLWRDAVDVRDFVQQNYTPYEGDGSFLAGPTERTTAVWDKLLGMFPAEIERGVHDVDAKTPSRIDAFRPGYIDGTAADHTDLIVGLQTDAPLKRAIMPNGGWRMVEGALNAYGYEADPEVREIYTHLRKTHNEGSSTPTPPRSAPAAPPASSPASRTPTAAAASSATTAASPSTVSTASSPPSRPTRTSSAPPGPPSTSSGTARRSPSRSRR